MGDTVNTQRGQALSLQVVFNEDENGTPLVLTGATVTVRESRPAVLQEASITVDDASSGVCTMALTEAQAEQLGEGRVNWFRLEAQFADDNIVTPKIWINVQ